jgi:DNA-binding NarL/FixJ family response regulator
VLKTASEERLRLALRSLFIEQQCVIDREIRGVQQKSQDQVLGLSDTEYEVLQDIALGLTDRAIASRRSLSLRSVQNRLQQLYEKLGVYQPTDRNHAFNLRARAVSIALLRKLLNRNALEQAEAELQQWISDPRHGYSNAKQQG